MGEQKKCLRPGCKSKDVNISRGLCRICHGAASKLVKRGKTTWEILEKNKKCLPRKKGVVSEWFLA